LYLKKQLQLHQPTKKIPWFILSLLIVVIDQITKYMAASTLSYAEPLIFLPYFNFTLLYNYGAAFSFLADQGGWQRVFFALSAAAVSVFLVLWILCVKTERKLEIAGLSLVLGGAIGNLWDRIYLGYVVDFIDWFYISSDNDCLFFFYSIFSTQSCHWPAFNIADSAIMLGAALLIIDMLVGEKISHQPPATSDKP
jgi:signal peptidase II